MSDATNNRFYRELGEAMDERLKRAFAAFKESRGYSLAFDGGVIHDAFLAGFEAAVSREGEVGSRSATEPDANLAGPEGDARPVCKHGYHAPHRYSRTFDGMIDRAWCHGPQS